MIYLTNKLAPSMLSGMVPGSKLEKIGDFRIEHIKELETKPGFKAYIPEKVLLATLRERTGAKLESITEKKLKISPGNEYYLIQPLGEGIQNYRDEEQLPEDIVLILNGFKCE